VKTKNRSTEDLSLLNSKALVDRLPASVGVETSGPGPSHGLRASWLAAALWARSTYPLYERQVVAKQPVQGEGLRDSSNRSSSGGGNTGATSGLMGRPEGGAAL